jgi:hypothetical protein
MRTVGTCERWQVPHNPAVRSIGGLGVRRQRGSVLGARQQVYRVQLGELDEIALTGALELTDDESPDGWFGPYPLWWTLGLAARI